MGATVWHPEGREPCVSGISYALGARGEPDQRRHARLKRFTKGTGDPSRKLIRRLPGSRMAKQQGAQGEFEAVECTRDPQAGALPDKRVKATLLQAHVNRCGLRVQVEEVPQPRQYGHEHGKQ
jgi:hypothetical protein